MIEIRFHGRGGQGARTAAIILASAFLKEGKYSLALPEFRSERRSAPIAVSLRVDEKPIILRSKIDAPDYLMVLDPSLLRFKQAGVMEGFKAERGLVIVSAVKDPRHLKLLHGCKVGLADVDAISRKYSLGPAALPATGTAILGVFAKVTKLLSLESVIEAIKESGELNPKQKEKSILAVKDAFNEAQIIEIEPSEQLNGEGNNHSAQPFRGWEGLPASVIALGDTRNNLTGSWRKIRPFYDSDMKISPCANACPLSNEIPQWLALIKQGKIRQAWEKLIEKNPLPASVGRICQAFCEISCNRKEFDEPLSIRSLEAFLGDQALSNGWRPELKERIKAKSPVVAIVGSGPAGLSCAFQLARKGYNVRIFERFPALGGLLRFGIPRHRLSKDTVESEIQNNILSLGMEAHVNYKIGEVELEFIGNNFDAVFVAAGLWDGRKIAVPGADNPNIISALDFLSSVNLGKGINIGDKVLVIGAGNTGIDAARVAKKFGADALVIELQKEKDVPSFEREGLEIHYETKLLRIESSGGKMKVFCQKGGEELVVRNIDMVITAIGQDPEFSPAEEGNLFIGGDLKTRAGNAASAIGSGRTAAEAIDRYLKTGQKIVPDKKQFKVVEFKDLNLAYFQHKKRSKSHRAESARCFSCGHCDLCGNCWKFCPHMSVFEKGGKMAINYDYCKGCGVCAQECPRAVISQELEV